MYKILNGSINQLNVGERQGKLYNSFNIDLSYNEGKVSIARRTILTTDSVVNMGTPIGFKYFDNAFFTVAGSRVFKNGGSPVGNFVEDTSANVPTTCSADYSDIENFGGSLAVSASNVLMTKVADGSGTGAWTARRTFSSITNSHPLCSYNNRLYWADNGNNIYSMDTAFAVSTSGLYTLTTIPLEYSIVWIRAYSNGLMIGTIHKYGSEGKVFDWDGVTENKINRGYTAYAQGALAGLIANDIPYIVNSNGEIRQFTGSGFSFINRFPVNLNSLYKATEVTKNDRFVHPNGMAMIDGKVCIFINNKDNNSTTTEYQENIHSGIWEIIGSSMNHKYSLSYRTRPDSGGSITDYGQIAISSAGGLSETPDIFGNADILKGNFLVGASFYKDATTTGFGIWTDSYYDNVEKSGFFTTVEIPAQHFEDIFQSIALLYNPTQNNKFVIKYRISKTKHVDFDINFTSESSFTTTQSGIVEGDEITIIQGKGSGRVAHVVGIPTYSAPDYTVILDESLTGASGTAKARQQKWKKVGKIESETRGYDESIIAQNGTLIEIKVVIVGTGDKVNISELVLDNTKNK